MLDLNLKPDRKTLRQFGWIALVGFGVLGGLIFWRGRLFGLDFGSGARPTAYVLWSLGAISALFSLIVPKANQLLFVGLTVLTFPIGFVVSHIIMGLIFYGILSPVGILFRLMGRDVLNRRFEPESATYWTDAQPPAKPDRYFRQF